MKLVKFLPGIDTVLIMCLMSVLQKFWVLLESRIVFKPVFVALSLIFMNRPNKTESAVFLYCNFSLFLKGPLFQIIHIT